MAYIKRLSLVAVILVILIATCAFSALLAFKMAAQENEPKLEAAEMSAHKSTLTLRLPFKMAPDEEFNVDPDIRYYIRSSTAFWGNSDRLTLHVYSVDFRTEILEKSWSPNIDNMSNITIITLQKNLSLTNQAHRKRPVVIAGLNVMEVISLYDFRGERYIQRVLHVPAQNSTWSVKAVCLAADNASQNIVTQIFNSFTLKVAN